MASRTPTRSGRSGRSPAPTSNPAPIVFGGIGVAVVVVLLLVMSGGDKDGASSSAPAPAAPATAASSPAAPAVESAKAGKPPARPAPPLSAETLQRARDLLAAAKTLSNEGVTARTAGNNEVARSKQSAASDQIEALKALTKTQWAWQEEAEMDDWALPPEYVALGKLYSEVSRIENQIRKGGGTR